MLIAGYQRQFTMRMTHLVGTAAEHGDASIVDDARAGGLEFYRAYMGVSEQLVRTASEYTASLVTALSNEARAAISREVRLAALGGRSITDLITRIGKSLDDPSTFKTLASRAEAIARTEVSRVYNMSAFDQATELAARLPGTRKVWEHSASSPGFSSHQRSHSRANHVACAEETSANPIPFDALFDLGSFQARYPHDPLLPASEVVNCFPADTRVHAEHVERAYRRWYAGPLVEITTALGYKLSGTPNHPILTDRGWVALGALAESDNIVCDRFTQRWSVCTQPHIQDMPATISEVFDLIALVGDSKRRRGRVMDFHGDGEDREVEVVSTDCKLRDGLQPTSRQPFHKLHFASSDLAHIALLSERLPHVPRFRGVHSPPCFIRGGGQSLAFVVPGLPHAQVHGRAAAARCDAGVQQPTPDDITGNLVLLREALDALPRHVLSNDGGIRNIHTSRRDLSCSERCINPAPDESGTQRCIVDTQCQRSRAHGESAGVQFDRLVDKRFRDYEGHVFNLQTQSGRYIAQGIISHNCRCRMVLIAP